MITTNPAGAGQFANHTGTVVAAAETAGLNYLQHIITVYARLHGERLLIPTTTPPRPAPTAPSPGAKPVVHVPVHHDLLLFTAPADVSGGTPQ